MEAVAEPRDKAVHYAVKCTVNFKFSGDSGINLINLNYFADTIKVNSQYICHGITESVKVYRKDQSVEDFTYFYYFGQFCVFL